MQSTTAAIATRQKRATSILDLHVQHWVLAAGQLARIDPGTRCRNRSLPEQNGSVPYQQRSRHVPSIEGHLFVAALLNRLYYAADRDRLARN